jgi:hypothetical protein
LFAILALATAIVLLAFPVGVPWLIPVAAGVYPLMRLRRRMTERGASGLNAFNRGIAAYMILTAALALGSISDSRLYPIWGILAAVILLNFDFYRFLARRMGGLDALAAVPFHLLFHFYSGFAMVAGVLKHFLPGHSTRLARPEHSGESRHGKTPAGTNKPGISLVRDPPQEGPPG